MTSSAQSCRERVIAAAAALSLAVTGAIAAVAPPAAAANSVSVSVDAALQLATVPATGIGVNIPVYDATMNAAATPGLLGTAGFNAVRYPGGSHSDVYHWQTGTAEGGAYVAPNTGFDAFMGTVRAAGAQPIITANYGSGTPQEAAAWVRYANVTKGYGVTYWEIGNEVYGNGEYSNGNGWEYDTHSSKSATTYANNLLQYISAMKAADPSVKIGAVLTTPGYWPDGIVGPGDTMDWNHTVLSTAGPKLDFAIVHAYPTSTSPADLLTKPQAQNANIAGAVRSLINQYAGSNAPNVGIAVTEANAQAYLDTSPNGLFAPDDYLTWLENGAFNVDWWDLRNGTDCAKVTTVEGATDYNDGGMVSSGASCEPALNTPFPAYYGTQMISRLGAPGDTLVKAASSSSLLSAHAVRRADGDVDVMLINKDPNNDATVNLSYAGFTPSSATPTVHSYLKNAHGIGTAQSGSPTAQTVPAYGITVVQMHPTGAACRVVYTKNEWAGVMVGTVTVVNNGLGQVNGWSLGFDFPGDNAITNSWNASASQNGPSVNAANVYYNPAVPQGGSVQWGFKATWSRSDADPSAFRFNGASCAIG
ncbi:cellulose binding domain-containing protein [Streptomyces sp. SP17BM10]|uniref:cellulose binding domain-containing protein n=1 Tax=Streptomyces sp. SP17BM10 TaxID=3002530 RepID=UPI002E786576|nr:cellulose binding domain-containing protein [Streptomyces sp. SP17BM10]MEE1788664.1 cellulose binding domain-containing protein [Streptomyces sp. SP17BM10]